jgi:hypothetical protein
MSLVDIKSVVQVAQSTLAVGNTALKLAANAINGATVLSSQGMAIYRGLNLSDNPTSTLQPVMDTKQQVLNIQQQALTIGREKGLPVQETLRVAALATASLFVTERSLEVQQAMQTFTSNPTPATLETFTRGLEVEQQSMVVRNISLAVERASLKIGFPTSQTSTTADGKTLRVISTDDCGRTLVTEISTEIDRETTIATEVTGVSDSSCSQILAEFAQALEEAGVRSTHLDRKFTGGIAELEATKEFVRRQPVKSRTPSASAKASNTQKSQTTRPQQERQL